MSLMGSAGELPRLQAGFEFAQTQVRRLVERHPDLCPAHTVDGQWQHDAPAWMDDAQGALPGMMWIFFEETGSLYWREKAEHYSRLLEPRKDDPSLAHPGFVFFHGTYRRWYEATLRDGRPNPAIRETLWQAAHALALRFRAQGGYLAFGLGEDVMGVDSMVDVPLVLHAAIETGDEQLMDVASKHTATARRHLVRGDGSTSQGVVFDLESGTCLRPIAEQGYRVDSCWSRGLACALYGFATCGKMLNFGPWLETARACSQYLLERLSGDPVPAWDFSAPENSRQQKDSGAAALAAAGLLELADSYVMVGPQEARQRKYLRDAAIRILGQLCEPEYLAYAESRWEGILKHGVYHMGKALGVDESVMWGEYFFVDALQRAIRLQASGQAGS